MSAKKLIWTLSAGTMLAAAAVPAMAYDGYGHSPYRGARGDRSVVVERNVASRPVYRAAPAYHGYNRYPGQYSGYGYYGRPAYAGSGYGSGYYGSGYYGRPAYAGSGYYGSGYYGAPYYRHDNAAIGAVGGGIVGAIIGNQAGYGDPGSTLVGAGVGAVLGGIIGSNIR